MPDRTVVKWGVFNNEGRCLRTFPFSARPAADEYAAQMTTLLKTEIYVNQVREIEYSKREKKVSQRSPQPDFPLLILDPESTVDDAMYLAVFNRFNALLAERGFKASRPMPFTTTWSRDPDTDQDFWSAWDRPRWVLLAARPGELWFGVEETLLLAALQAALGNIRHDRRPADLAEALRQLGGTVQGLEGWRRWKDRLAFGGQSFLAGQYGVALTDENLERLVNDLVDGLVTFVCQGRPWLSQGTGVAPRSDLRGNGIPVPEPNPFHPFLRLSCWLANEMSFRGYTLRGPVAVLEWLAQSPRTLHHVPDPSMSASLSWHPPSGNGWPHDDRVVKLVHRQEGVYWFGVRETYVGYRSVPATLFAQNHIVNDVWFSGFWVRDTERSRQRILGVLNYL